MPSISKTTWSATVRSPSLIRHVKTADGSKAETAAAGGVKAALIQAQKTTAAKGATFIEIEVETLVQLEEALNAGARMVLLDNMDLVTLRQAVALNSGRAVLEVSGGVSLKTVREIAATGVDRISIGALTKDVRATDFSMRFEEL